MYIDSKQKVRPAALSFLLLIVTSMQVASDGEREIITIGVFMDGSQHRINTTQALLKFQRLNPGINLKVDYHIDPSLYVEQANTWFADKKGPDIFYWLGGTRLRKDHVKNLQHLWNKYGWEKQFSKPVIDAISIDGEPHAIPINSHYWVFYYRKSFFEKHNISPPTQWDEILETCRYFRKNNIDLFTIGSDTAWVTHAWLDYLVLRIHGMEFYRELTAGRISYTDSRVIEVFEYWKVLLDNGCFNSNHKSYGIWHALPRIFHEKSAMALLYGPPMDIPEEIYNDLEILNFPGITPGIPAYTVTPVNVYVVPKYTSITPNIEKLLVYISSSEFQREYNKDLNRSAAHLEANRDQSRLLKMEIKALKNAPEGIQYFDRETKIELAKYTPDLLVEFLLYRDIEDIANKTESIREKVFGKLTE